LAARLANRSRDLSAALAQAQFERDRADDEARQAESAQHKAQSEAARSAANAEFLQAMLDSVSQAIVAGDARPAKAMVLDAKARSRYREALRLLKAALGPGHPDTLRTTGDLAIVIGSQGRFEEPFELQRNLLAARTRLFGPTHRYVALTMCNIGNLLRANHK